MSRQRQSDRETPTLETKVAGHEVFHVFLADARPGDLPALDHLAACPLCQAMTRMLRTSGGAAIAGGRHRSDRKPRPATLSWRRHR